MRALISLASTLLSVWAVRRAGCAGVVACSAVNLTLRIGYSLVFVRSYQRANFPELPLSRMLPAPAVCAAAAALCLAVGVGVVEV